MTSSSQEQVFFKYHIIIIINFKTFNHGYRIRKKPLHQAFRRQNR